jgi:PAS domain S-box-containing protein
LIVRPQDLGIGRLSESVRDAVIVAEASTGKIVLWNPAATEVFGYLQSEALGGLRVEALVPQPFKAQHRAGMSRYCETGHGPYIDSNKILDLPALRKTGEEIRIELSLSPIESSRDLGIDGRFVLAIVRDVTDRKRAEEELGRLNEDLENQVEERTTRLIVAVDELKSREQAIRASEERFRLLVEGVRDYAIFMLDPEGRVADWNTGAERLLGYGEAEMMGQHFALLFTPEDIRQGAPERELRKAVDEGRAEDER